MKNIAALLISIFIGAGAAASTYCQGDDWKKKMQCEKIAFLTTELDITPEEAQAFWPVYNQVEADRDKAMHEVFKAFKALDQALEESRSEKEISNLLDEYTKAIDNQKEVENDRIEKYEKVLSSEKVARLLIGEEKFRRQHIRRLHDKPRN